MDVVTVRNLTKVYRPPLSSWMLYREKRKPIKAVDGLSFSVKEGEIFGLLGPNGAGKSTTMKIILGITRPTSGSVLVSGRDIYSDYPGYKLSIGYMPENLALPDKMRLMEYMKFAAGFYLPRDRSDKRIKEVLKDLSLWDRRYDRIGDLSQGYKRRVLLAQAIVHEPDIVVLDEPTNGLDPEAIVEFRMHIRELNREGTTIIMASHILDEVQRLSTSIGIINRGRLVLGGPTDRVIEEMRKVSESTVIIGGKGIDTDTIRAVVSSLDYEATLEPCSRGVSLSGIDEAQLESILKRLYEKGFVPTLVMPEEPTLEDVYMGVIRDEVRLEL